MRTHRRSWRPQRAGSPPRAVRAKGPRPGNVPIGLPELYGIRRVVFPVCAVVGGQADTRDMSPCARYSLPASSPNRPAETRSPLFAEDDEDMADGGERQTRIIRIHPFEPASGCRTRRNPDRAVRAVSDRRCPAAARDRAVLHGAREKIGAAVCVSRTSSHCATPLVPVPVTTWVAASNQSAIV